MCRDFKSGNRCIYGNYCLFRHADGEEKPSKRSKRESTQGAVAILKQRSPRLCISKFRSEEVYSTETWASQIERFGGTHHKILKTEFGTQKGHLEALSTKVTLISEILARQSLRKEHRRGPHDKKIAPARQRGIWRQK